MKLEPICIVEIDETGQPYIRTPTDLSDEGWATLIACLLFSAERRGITLEAVLEAKSKVKRGPTFLTAPPKLSYVQDN